MRGRDRPSARRHGNAVRPARGHVAAPGARPGGARPADGRRRVPRRRQRYRRDPGRASRPSSRTCRGRSGWTTSASCVRCRQRRSWTWWPRWRATGSAGSPWSTPSGLLLAARLGGTYLRRTAEGRQPGEPDLTVRVAVRNGAVAAALRIAARPLHRREWKLDTGPGTLHPPVAAALARLAAPEPGQTVLDPFCGDGTIAIETALAFPRRAWSGSDLDPVRLKNAARNAERAGVSVTLTQADAGRPGTGADAVITNPPWNLAVDGSGTLRDGLEPAVATAARACSPRAAGSSRSRTRPSTRRRARPCGLRARARGAGTAGGARVGRRVGLADAPPGAARAVGGVAAACHHGGCGERQRVLSVTSAAGARRG